VSDNEIVLDISVPGTFWAFRIAREVAKRGGDVELYTSTPAFARYDHAPIPVHTIYHPFFIEEIGHQIPAANRLFGFSGFNRPFQRWGNYLFDNAVGGRLNSGRASSGLFLGFAGACRNALRRANELGYVTAVERSSTHIRTQRSLLQEEYERHGIDGQPISERHAAREGQEYDAADYIVTPSEFTAESFREQGVAPEKLVQIPFGTDTGVIPPDRDNEEEVTFVFAGHVSLRKGIQYLLPAWDRLSLPNATLQIAGRVGETVADVVEAYEDGDSIEFLGWVDDVDALYRDASVFVFPTIEEGSARVTYEAMSWGLSVITTPHSGWVGTDGDHGVEVSIRDVKALASAMKQLYDDAAQRRAMGRRGRSLMEREYTWDAYADRVWGTYRGMIDS
jgi:glycosyltransferase involved in cell wall biosynthesis